MLKQYELSIARIFDSNGTVVGVGFLISPSILITCAHVISRALGLAQSDFAMPQSRVNVDFPLLNQQHRLAARVISWWPYDKGTNLRDDICLLELIDTKQLNLVVASNINTSEDFWGRSFRVFGFPINQSEGVWVSGICRGRQASGLIQLESIKETGYRIQPGFSGAPVWGEYGTDILGMVVAAERNENVKAAFMISGRKLLETLSSVGLDTQQAQISPLKWKQDWNGAIIAEGFVGRVSELSTLQSWIVRDQCRLVNIWGLGGIGKSSLAIRLGKNIESSFDYIIWRSLKNALSLDHLLRDCIQFFSGHQYVELPEDTNELLSVFMDFIRKQRCLMILDNYESLLRERDKAGRYLVGYEQYEQLILNIGETSHQSCLIVTTREKPRELIRIENNRGSVRSFVLPGLDEESAKQFLDLKGLVGTDVGKLRVIRKYAANPLALQLIIEPIQTIFGGSIDKFLDEGALVFDDIYSVLHQQFSRLSDLEGLIMYWLAIDRELVSMDDLLRSIIRLSELAKELIYWLTIEREGATLSEILGSTVNHTSKREVMDELASLHRRSLIEINQARFTLQPVVMEFMTEQFIEKICEEIIVGRPSLFTSHAIIQAQAKDNIRQSQIRLLLKPIVERLALTYKSKSSFTTRLIQLISNLRQKSLRAPGYTAGNTINLLLHQKIDISGFDFSDLTIAQAYLQGFELKNVDFTGSDLSQSVFTETFGSIFSVAFSPDGKFLAAGSVDGEIRLWQVTDNANLNVLSDTDLIWCTSDTHDDWVWCIGFSPDGKIIASGNDNSLVKLWDAQTGEWLATFESHRGRVWSVKFSHDGLTLISVSDDKTIKVWDIGSNECLFTIDGHSDRIVSLDCAKDKPLVVTASVDSTVKLWDLDSGELVGTIEIRNTTPISVAVSPLSNIIAVGHEDHNLSLWSIHSLECVQILSGHAGRVQDVKFSPDGSTLASASEDRTIRIWNILTGECQNVLQGHDNLVWSVSFNFDGFTLASGSEDQTIRLWDIKTGQNTVILKGYTNQLWSTAISQDGKFIAGGYEDHKIRIWDISQNKSPRLLSGHSNRVRSIKFSQKGSFLFSAGEDYQIIHWNLRSGRSIRTLRGHTGIVWSIAISDDGNLLISGSDDCTLRLWDTRTGNHTDILSNLTVVWSVAVTSDGLILGSGHEDYSVRIWDRNTKECIHVLSEHTDRVRSVAFSGDDHYLISGSEDMTAKVWDIKTGICIQTLIGHSHFVKAVSFSSDSCMVATGSDDRMVKVWDAVTGQCIHTLSGHSNQVKSVCFSQDSTKLISGDEDGHIYIWDINSELRLQHLCPERPYENMDITGVVGLNDSQLEALKVLGAIDRNAL